MNRRLVFLLALVFTAGCGSKDSCDGNIACAPGSTQSYHLCNGANGCYYRTGDGQTFHCTTCGDCSNAEAEIVTWCGAAAGSNCGAAVTCTQGSGSYQACTTPTGSACSFKTSDGTVFSCNSCADCVGAAQQATDWCAGARTTMDMGSGATCDVPAGMAVAGPCDPVKQDCGAGMKCVGTFDAMGNISSACEMTGSAVLGPTCKPTVDHDGVPDDNCPAGQSCAFPSYPSDLCQPYCHDDRDCTRGQRCSALGASLGWCVPTCDPSGNGCPTGSDCSSIWYLVPTSGGSGIGFFFCKQTGTSRSACSLDSDCAAGFRCDNTACVANCDATHPCASGLLPCQALACQPNGAGICRTP